MSEVFSQDAQSPIAIWNPARDVWETESIDLFSELSDVYSETLPPSGSMRSGALWKRPRLVPRTGGSGFSLLPTPQAYDAMKGGPQHPDKRRAGNHSVGIADVVMHL